MIDRTILGGAAEVLPVLVKRILELRKAKGSNAKKCECSTSTVE
jgi:hypothetical protein